MIKGKKLLSVLLGASIVLWQLPPARAQVQPRIDMVVVGGEGAVNQTRQRVSQDPLVRIQDQDAHPLAGAAVTFNLPISGTSGEFMDGSKNLTVVTGPDGIAAARGIRTNEVPGRFQILITASYRGLTARALINQQNQGTQVTSIHGGHTGKIVAILAIIGVAAAGGVYAATRRNGNNSPPAPAPIGITPGTGAIGAP